jgi:hypothetical protein
VNLAHRHRPLHFSRSLLRLLRSLAFRVLNCGCSLLLAEWPHFEQAGLGVHCSVLALLVTDSDTCCTSVSCYWRMGSWKLGPARQWIMRRMGGCVYIYILYESDG